MTLGKPLHIHSCLMGDRASSQYNSFTQVMLLERSLVGDTWKTLHCHSGLLGDRDLSEYDCLTLKMALEKSFVSESIKSVMSILRSWS